MMRRTQPCTDEARALQGEATASLNVDKVGMFENQMRRQEEREGWGGNKCFENLLGSTLDSS